MPLLSLSDLNVSITILGAFLVSYGFLSVKIKQVWYLGEALPAVVVGIALGQVGARWIDPRAWGFDDGQEQQNAITLGLCRIVIGVQLVIAGFQLPRKYQLQRWKEMALLLLAAMTMMWFSTSACIIAVVPKITWLAALVIGSCVTCTDPILSQAVAKGPFADKYVRRPLREIISSEAGANDGFGFPFLMLAVYLIRYAANSDIIDLHHEAGEHGARLLTGRSEHEDIGRLGGGPGAAVSEWVVETWLYFVVLSVFYGAFCGYVSMHATRFALRRKWIDGELYLLWPTGLGLFIVGTCGLIGTDDLLACFVAGNLLNWDGSYLEETEACHDEVNSCVDVLLNFGGFMYIGAILPWSDFHDPNGTGLTYGRLIALGFLVLFLRRIPAIFALCKLMPKVCQDWKEALFMGYFGPIGIGAVFYIEHTRHLFPEPGEATTNEENDLTAVMVPVVYWLVFFSIIVHGLSIPALNIFFKWRNVKPIEDELGPVEIELHSRRASVPKNARVSMEIGRRTSIIVNNRFSRGFATPDLGRSFSMRNVSKGDVGGGQVDELDDCTPIRKYVTEPSTGRRRDISFADETQRPKPAAREFV